MKILYISTVFPEIGTSTIYTDLAEALVEHGHEVTVLTTEEKRKHKPTAMMKERGCNVLRVKTGNIYDVGLIEKGISTITMAWLMKRAIKSYLSEISVDLILFEAPPVTMASVVSFAKDIFCATSFLMMKDIFPQNAVDLGIMKKGSPVCRYFEYKERELYHAADHIGCMSKGNLEYLEKVLGVDYNKLSVFPNTKKINSFVTETKKVRERYQIAEDKVVFVFGGNMGKPQGMDFLAEGIIRANEIEDAFFILVGRGTERDNIQEKLKAYNNNLVLTNLPRDEYEELVCSCDVGIISLDCRFTIPNYPSRVLSYMEYDMPVLAVTDRNTDFIELILDEANCGIWCESQNVEGFVQGIKKLVEDAEMRKKLGANGRKYLEDNFTVEKSVALLEKYYLGK